MLRPMIKAQLANFYGSCGTRRCGYLMNVAKNTVGITYYDKVVPSLTSIQIHYSRIDQLKLNKNIKRIAQSVFNGIFCRKKCYHEASLKVKRVVGRTVKDREVEEMGTPRESKTRI